MFRAKDAFSKFCKLRVPRRTRAIVQNLTTKVPIGTKRAVLIVGSVAVAGLSLSEPVFLDDRKGGRRRRRPVRNGNDFCTATKSGDLNLVRELSEKPNFDPSLRHELGFGAVHIAVVENNYEMLRVLIDLGADVNQQDMCGPHEGQRRVDEFSSNIRPDSPTQGFTPLHYAVALRQEELIELLIQNGADPSKKDSVGRAATQWVDRRTQSGQELLHFIEEQYEIYLDSKEERDRVFRRQFPLEDQLKKKIVGQLAPIHSVASAIRRKQNGWHDDEHPLVFLFLGSSGVGKTELAKTVAKCLMKDDPQAFIRIDMSEFQHKHEVAKFIGSPPGYVGHEEGGQLTKRLKERPNSIVLLDEVEKAHPDVLTIMLQLFDEGRITDGRGETIECKDAMFVMTSNLAQTQIGDEAESLRKEAKEKADIYGLNDEATSLSREFIEDIVQPILKDHFKRDEFLGRINEILYFLPFNDIELRELTLRELQKWERRAKERHNIVISWSDSSVEELQSGYNYRYGARSIQHEVEKRVVNQIAKAHELDRITEKSSVHVDCKDGVIFLSFTDPPESETTGNWW